MIKENLTKINPDMVVLQETKRELLEDMVVLVLWDVRSIRFVDTLVGSFSVSIKIQRGVDFWRLSGVYGKVPYKDRKWLWEELAGLQVVCGNKWF